VTEHLLTIPRLLWLSRRMPRKAPLLRRLVCRLAEVCDRNLVQPDD
jgi:hypothetical protein